jgi:hypothetical protein
VEIKNISKHFVGKYNSVGEIIGSIAVWGHIKNLYITHGGAKIYQRKLAEIQFLYDF